MVLTKSRSSCHTVVCLCYKLISQTRVGTSVQLQQPYPETDPDALCVSKQGQGECQPPGCSVINGVCCVSKMLKGPCQTLDREPAQTCFGPVWLSDCCLSHLQPLTGGSTLMKHQEDAAQSERKTSVNVNFSFIFSKLKVEAQ